MEYGRIILLLGIFKLVAAGVYVDKSFPYIKGPLATDDQLFNPITGPLNPIPMHTRVWFPADEGTYAVWYYIGGFNGIIPAGMYEEVMQKIASHGIIVAGTWPVIGDDGPAFRYEDHLRNVQWLKDNLASRISAEPSWKHLALGCHSAGCGTTYEMSFNDTSLAKATIHLEPVSGAVRRGGVNFIQPAMILGAGLAGSCAPPPNNFESFYDEWTCPKFKLEVKDVGHCDFLDDTVWTVCHVTGYCTTGDKMLVRRYRDFIQGLVTTFMRAYVLEDEDATKWFMDENLMPVEMLQHEFDLKC